MDETTLGEVFSTLKASPAGLRSDEAAARLRQTGANRLRDDDGNHPLTVVFRQFRSPMVLILLGAAALSFFLGEVDEACIVAVIVLASTGLGFYQEYRAGNAVAELRRRIAVTSTVLRDGERHEIPVAEIVPGDVLLLSAGSLISADAVLIDAIAFHADEAALTGESFPATKTAASDAAPIVPDNRIHMGTSVRSGEGRAVVTATGLRTDFGRIVTAVAGTEPESSFSRGTKQFGLLMTQIMLVLVTLVLAANVLLGRPVLDSLLFAAALAVGITPELLPAIVTVTLSRGAKLLTEKGVLVRRLVAIENLGSMDVLCTDKTGTLTQGDVTLDQAVDAEGKPSDSTLRWALLNASLQTAMANPLDEAILAARDKIDLSSFTKRGEVPYDFERKRLSILVASDTTSTLICKGAVGSLLPICTSILSEGHVRPLDADRLEVEQKRLESWSGQGVRVVAVAVRDMDAGRSCAIEDEAGMTLVGYLLFSDPLKPAIRDTVAALRSNGINLKIISGDNRFVTAHVAEAIGLTPHLVTGEEIDGLAPLALARRAAHANAFAEVTPDQKERLIAVFRRTGHVVGYMGDGINDAPALRAADIGISVDNAVDAAKAAADVILLKQDLNVLLDGVIAGRTAFGNTIKYIRITLSSNAGNMISMALASVVLPFLPLLAIQILLNNLLSDLPMLAISTDRVDAEVLEKPALWNFPALIRSMLGFGLISSAFDALTFAVLLLFVHADQTLFQTSWFVESLLTELAIVAVMRTSKPFFMSRPSRLMLVAQLAVAIAGIAISYTPLAGPFGFTHLPVSILWTIAGIVVAYIVAAELLKDQINLRAIGPDRPTRARHGPTLRRR